MAARNYLLKAIHCYPEDASLYQELLLLSLNQPLCQHQPVLRLSRSKIVSRRLVAIGCLMTADIRTSLREAQAAVHANPGDSLVPLFRCFTQY